MLNKICTSFETSKRLKELGIEGETGFFWWVSDFDKKYRLTSEEEYIYPDKVGVKTKAYTLETILEMLPQYISNDALDLSLRIRKSCVYYKNNNWDGSSMEDGKTMNLFFKGRHKKPLVNPAAQLLIKLKQDKII